MGWNRLTTAKPASIVNLEQATKSDTIEAAFRALGKRLELTVA